MPNMAQSAVGRLLLPKPCPLDRMILENSGVAEPRNILQRFSAAEQDGHSLQAKIRLDSLVTVVDAHSFSKDWGSRMPVISRPDLGEGGALRPVVDLLVEQIEYAAPVNYPKPAST